MNKSQQLVLASIAGLSALILAWIYLDIYSVGLLSVLAVWYLFSLSNYHSDKKLVKTARNLSRFNVNKFGYK